MELGFGLYFGLGIIAIVILDLCTGRVRKRLREASHETQTKFAGSGSYVGEKVAMFLTILALWLLWPFAIYGAIRSLGKKGSANGQK